MISARIAVPLLFLCWLGWPISPAAAPPSTSVSTRLEGPIEPVTQPPSPERPAAARSVRLTNGRIRADFDDRGLASVTDTLLVQQHDFTRDEFSLTIGGQAFSSASLPTPERTVSTDSVTYAWTAGAHRVSVTYELGAKWRFVSKQISIVGAPQPTVRVDHVTVFRLGLTTPVSDMFVPASARQNLGTGDYGAFLRFDAKRSLLVTAQNPFLTSTREGQLFTLAYKPEMDWNMADGPFVADRGLIAAVQLTGRRLPAKMTPEWVAAPPPARPAPPAPGLDEAEIDAYTDLVRAFLLVRADRPVNVLVGWCLNDYQIDVATPDGRAEYKRVMDQASAVGAEYVLYAPSNSEISRREQSVDDWSWEHVLWLNLGQKIRANQWEPKTGPIPASLQEMLDYARSKNLKLLAYVYPVLPFSQNPSWLVPDKRNPNRKWANLGFRSLQDFLIETLVAFHDRLGLGGYAFDHTFLNYDGTSRYAQWAGWRRVMEELRRRIPDIVVDGRQAYHLYGPWSWLAGSYPHPTFSDEQPESFVPFPDLHFDRVSADRERYTAYRYRNYEFAPSEIVPGFMTHQTSRSDDTDEMPARKTEDRGVVLLPFRARDWDSLGFQYSVLSSIAVAGWNNVIDMIPARDVDENRAFSQEGERDRAWFRKWLDWTRANKEMLRHTRTIVGQPAMGKIDGTSAIVGDGGFIFLFNPNGRRLTQDLPLDASIGLPPNRRLVLRELYPVEGRQIGKPGAGPWSSGDRVSLALDGGSALVLQVQATIAPTTVPLVFNVPGTATLDNGVVNVTGARAEVGTEQEVQVLLPRGQEVNDLRVNGQPVQATRIGQVMTARLQFDGEAFRRYQQIGEYDPAFAGGRLSAKFTVPRRVFDQLALRRKTWPIDWKSEDYQATWLAPDRLLLFVQIAEPDPKWEAKLWIDGRAVELRKAYTAIRATAPRTFVGFYADVTLLAADVPHLLELQLPSLKPGQLQGVFFENVETEYTDVLRIRRP